MCLDGDTEISVKYTKGLETNSLIPRYILSLSVVQYDTYLESILSGVIACAPTKKWFYTIQNLT